jgi:hypothetical protein
VLFRSSRILGFTGRRGTPHSTDEHQSLHSQTTTATHAPGMMLL